MLRIQGDSVRILLVLYLMTYILFFVQVILLDYQPLAYKFQNNNCIQEKLHCITYQNASRARSCRPLQHEHFLRAEIVEKYFVY